MKFTAGVMLVVAALLATSCAYHHFQRRYEVIGGWTSADNGKLATAIRQFFLSNGLVLEREYSKASSTESLHFVFTLPPIPGVHRKQGHLLVAIKPGSVITVEQSEWFLIPGGEPKNYIESIVADLLSMLKAEFGESATVRLIFRSHY